MKFDRVFLIGAILATGMTHATAADLAPRPYLKAPPIAYLPWNDEYVGVTLGYTEPENDPRLTPTGAPAGLPLSVTLGNVNTNPGRRAEGVIGGGTIGLNRQYQSLVIGFEGDVSGSSARSRFLSVQGPAVVTNIGNQETDVLGSLRGRLGVAVDKTLFYGTAGLAFGHVKNNFAIIGPAIPGATSLATGEDSWKAGWTAGGGIEHIFAPNWSVKAEYLYYSLGRSTLNLVTTAGPVETGTISYKNDGHIIRAGVNYHFNLLR